jgi:hypothetical protein
LKVGRCIPLCYPRRSHIRPADKGLSTREIAKITGWSPSTIKNDLAKSGQEAANSGQPRPSTTGGRAEAREIAKITGWAQRTIARDLEASQMAQKASQMAQPRPSTTGGRAEARAAIAAEAEIGDVALCRNRGARYARRLAS